MRTRVAVRASSAAVLSLAGWLACGCGGGDYAAELSARPRTLALRGEEGRTIRLPADEKFSIYRAPSQQDPGLGGSASADGHATPDGAADCRAQVDGGGEATATFQLGHAFANETDRQMDLDVALRFAYDYAVDASPPDAPVDARVGLKLYARDNRNRLLRNNELLAHAAERGAAERAGREDYRFSLTIGPGASVSVYIAGQSTVKADFGRSGRVALKVAGLEMDVTSRLAPPVQTAADEQR